MPDPSRFILSRLFIAVPELQWDVAFLEVLKGQGLVTDYDLENARKIIRGSKKAAGLASRMRGKTLIERIMLVSPELMSVTTINLLRSWNIIDPTLGNALRVGLKAGKVLNPGKLEDKTALQRLAALGDSVLSVNTINLLRNLDELRIQQLASGLPDTPENRAAIRELLRISVLRGQQLRSVLSTGRLAADVIAAAKNANTIWGIITVVAEGLLSDKLLKNAIRAGAITQERYELIKAIERLGVNVWKKIAAGLANHNSFEARALLLSEGLLSPEMVRALRVAGFISKELEQLLYPAANAVRSLTRNRLQDHMKGIRSRVIPGEPPIKSYARIVKATDDEILRLLAEAARESRREAERLAKSAKFGKLTKAAQQRLIEDAIYKQMRALWESVGHLTIFGEKEAARAAQASADFLQDSLWKGTSKQGADFRRSVYRQAEAGIDGFISRSENTRLLSRRVYKNIDLANGLVSRRININLLRGMNARDFAADISSLIRPGVRGGVSYAAMRLSRTEINNAFHNTQIRYTREMPWVNGYRWNLSGSHPTIDICNAMAQGNHDGLGRGVYKKGNVPQKPHPHCFCYLTTVTDDNSEFERKLSSGAYNSYLSSVEKSGVYDESKQYNSENRSQAKQIAEYATTAVAASIVKSVTASSSVIEAALQ